MLEVSRSRGSVVEWSGREEGGSLGPACPSEVLDDDVDEEEEDDEEGEKGEGEDLEKIELHVERALWSTGHLSASASLMNSFIFEWSTGHFSA